MAKKTDGKKYFTIAQANAALPLVRAIVQDITDLARTLQERQERLKGVFGSKKAVLGDAHREELESIRAEFERERERMEGYEEELKKLGVELKDHMMGLVDFRSRMEGREVYLCWRLGEPEIAFWHDLEAGFGGRQRLLADADRGAGR